MLRILALAIINKEKEGRLASEVCAGRSFENNVGVPRSFHA